MFRPNVAIIMFSSESMVVVLYRIGMGMSWWWDLSICDVCYMLFLRGTGGICDVRYPGVCSSSMSAHCCPMWVSCYCLSISDVYCWWAFVMSCVCSLSFVSVVISVSSPFCVCVYLSSILGVSYLAVRWPGPRPVWWLSLATVMVIITWHCAILLLVINP